MLKYIRFRDGKKLEEDKLLELIDAMQDALPTKVPQTNPSLHPSVPSAHNEPTSVPMTKANECTSHSSNTVPVQTIPAATKLEKQDGSSNTAEA
jgi:hypothetical protein